MSKIDPSLIAKAALAQFRFTADALLPSAVVETMSISAEFKEHINQWAMKIHAFVWSEGLELDTYTIEIVTPKTWWQHFKLQCMPKWFNRLFPIQVERVAREIKIERKALYPKLPLLLPENAKEFGEYVIRLDVKDTPIH